MIRRNFLKVLALFGAKATLTATAVDETKIKAIELNECYVLSSLVKGVISGKRT